MILKLIEVKATVNNCLPALLKNQSYEIISNGITLYQRFDNTMLGSFLAACAGTYTFKGESYTSAQEAIAAHKVFINV